MSEFRIHHDVNELLSLLRVHGGDGAEVYIDLLQKNRTPYVSTTVSAHSAKVKIAEFSRTPEDFLKKYDELKSKNTRNLDPLVYLLSKLTEDRETLQYLHQNAKDRGELAASAAASSAEKAAGQRDHGLHAAAVFRTHKKDASRQAEQEEFGPALACLSSVGV